MNAFRRILSATLLAFAILASYEGPAACAEADITTITVKTVEASPGETVDLTACIMNNPGILGANLRLTYSDGLTLEEIEAGEALGALTMTKPGNSSSPCNLLWDGTSLEPKDIRDGVLVTLRFHVAEDVPVGSALDVRFSAPNSGSVVNDKLTPVPLTFISGGISVTAASLRQNVGTVDGDRLAIRVTSEKDLKDAKLVVAGFDKSGAFKSCLLQTVQVTRGNNMFQADKSFTAYSYRAFLLGPQMLPWHAPISISEGKLHAVVFQDYDGSVLCTQYVMDGESPVPPVPPLRTGFRFANWDKDFSSVTADLTLNAVYQVDNEPTLMVDSVSAAAGESAVTVDISIRNNPGILGMILAVSYNEDALKLLDGTNGSALDGVLTMTSPGKNVSPCSFVWDGTEITQENIRDGQVLRLTFSVSPNAQGDYPITVSYLPNQIINNSLEVVHLAVVPGCITVMQ